MPSSSTEGKTWIVEQVQRLHPTVIVDVGVGCGTYSELLRSEGQYWVGVEKWRPYLDTYNLYAKYDLVAVQDVREFDFTLYQPDLVILGDVLEHMPKPDAVQVVTHAQIAAAAVLISIPIVHYPQEACEGNPYEAHLKDDWSHAEMQATFPDFSQHWTGTEIGVYLWTR